MMEEKPVWESTDRTPGMQTLRTLWAFNKKADGRYKARLVVDGSQQIGLAFKEISSSVAHKSSLRVVLSLINHLDLHAHTIDVKSAFLNGTLDHDVFITPPSGVPLPPGRVLRLRRSLYGLREAPLVWRKELDSWLRSLSFRPTSADACVYTRRRNDKLTLIALHVDDQLVVSDDLAELEEFKHAIDAKYGIVDNGEVSDFLGMRITRDRPARKLWISQESFVENLLESFDLADAKSVATPLPPGFAFSPATDAEFAAAKHLPFPKIIGSVLWLANTSRPDIAHASSLLSRALAKWSLNHYDQARNLLRYLAGTRSLALTLNAFSSLAVLEGHVDADWAGDLETRRSTTGYIMWTHGGAIAWKSARQPSVATSTTAAEYIASSTAASEILFLRRFLDDLGLLPAGPTPLRNDNIGAVALSTSTFNHNATKHIDIRRHFLRETVEDGSIDLIHIEGKLNIADFFTKALPRFDFERLRMAVGMERIPNQGGVLDSGV